VADLFQIRVDGTIRRGVHKFIPVKVLQYRNGRALSTVLAVFKIMEGFAFVAILKFFWKE